MEKSKKFIRCKAMNKTMEEASNMAPPKALFYSFIFENETTILMADTNVGKSILAVQIGNDVAGMVKETESVLYVDLEMSEKQLEGRYSDNFKNHYKFRDNFIRLDINPDGKLPSGKDYTEFFIEQLTKAIDDYNSAFVIIDNMSALVAGDTDTAQKAIPMMEKLRELKREQNITLLILDHTRKTDCKRPITHNDLQGSKMKPNLADAVFAIGRSAKDENLRYLKQLKIRSSFETYGANNVMVMELTKDVNNLQFNFVGFSTEQEHLKIMTEEQRQDRIEDALVLKQEGYSNRQIALKYGVSEGAVRKWWKAHDKKNRLQSIGTEQLESK